MAMTLPKPEGIKVEVRPAAIAQAAADPEIVDKYEACVGEWADLTTKLLDEEPEPATDDDDDIGPRTELAFTTFERADMVDANSKSEAKAGTGDGALELYEVRSQPSGCPQLLSLPS